MGERWAVVGCVPYRLDTCLRVCNAKTRASCVSKSGGESLGGHDVVRNSGDNEERRCVLCLVSFFSFVSLVFFSARI